MACVHMPGARVGARAAEGRAVGRAAACPGARRTRDVPCTFFRRATRLFLKKAVFGDTGRACVDRYAVRRGLLKRGERSILSQRDDDIINTSTSAASDSPIINHHTSL